MPVQKISQILHRCCLDTAKVHLIQNLFHNRNVRSKPQPSTLSVGNFYKPRLLVLNADQLGYPAGTQQPNHLNQGRNRSV